MLHHQNKIKISVIIVNYKVPDYLCQVLRSLQEADLYSFTETIIVDNASHDNSRETVTSLFPEVIWIALKTNIGFGKACNIGAQKAQGKYLLLLNPDTLISKNTLRVFSDNFDNHPQIGIIGPKIIDQDGTFQPYCRRSFPHPFSSFLYIYGLSRLFYFLKLDRIFPQNKIFGQYNLNYLDPEKNCKVDAVSGSCMFIRQSLFQRLEGFDKDFFMFGEDLDICARCHELGFEVWYNPETQIIHFKGKSSTKNVIRSRMAFYEAMIIFSKKYHHTYGAFFPAWIVTFGIVIKAVMNIGMTLLKSSTACFIDLIVINLSLWAITAIRFTLTGAVTPYVGRNILIMMTMHLIISLSFLITFAIQGVYSAERYSSRNTFFSSIIASVIFLTSVYFIKSMAFSRVAFALSTLLITLLLISWRKLLPHLVSHLKQHMYATGKVILFGNGPLAALLIKDIEHDNTAQIVGVIATEQKSVDSGEFEGYPVLGKSDTFLTIMKKQKADLLIIATSHSWYSSVIEALTFLHLKHLTIKWVSPELFKQPIDQLPEKIPLNDFSV